MLLGIIVNVPVTAALREFPLLSTHVESVPAPGVTPVPLGSAASYQSWRPLIIVAGVNATGFVATACVCPVPDTATRGVEAMVLLMAF